MANLKSRSGFCGSGVGGSTGSPQGAVGSHEQTLKCRECGHRSDQVWTLSVVLSGFHGLTL